MEQEKVDLRKGKRLGKKEDKMRERGSFIDSDINFQLQFGYDYPAQNYYRPDGYTGQVDSSVSLVRNTNPTKLSH